MTSIVIVTHEIMTLNMLGSLAKLCIVESVYVAFQVWAGDFDFKISVIQFLCCLQKYVCRISVEAVQLRKA